MNERRNIDVTAAMKIRLALLLPVLCSLALSAWAAGATTLAEYAAEMSVNAEVQEQFFARYPDLKDEADVVAAATRALITEAVSVPGAAAPDVIAARAREVLAQRTPQEWQRKAMSLYPELAVAGSEFNALFLRHHLELKRMSPQFMEEPSWPVLLARRCAEELRAQVLPPPTTAVASSNAVLPVVAVQVTPAFRASWWSSLVNLALLLAISAQGARWLLCRSRAFAGPGVAVSLWQQALHPTAWACIAFALIALFRTFHANADQRFLDRFGITLLVSLLAGLVLAIPAYGIALAVLGWRRRRTVAGLTTPRA